MGGGTGGSVGMAETPKFMGMGIQGAIAESQIEVNKASAEKLKSEAIKIAGVDTDLGKSQIANLNANTGNTEADTIIKNLQATGLEIDNYIKNSSAEFEISQAEYLSGKLSEEMKNLEITITLIPSLLQVQNP